MREREKIPRAGSPTRDAEEDGSDDGSDAEQQAERGQRAREEAAENRGDDDGRRLCVGVEDVVRVLDDDGDQQAPESLVEDHSQGDAVEAKEDSLKQFLAREILEIPRTMNSAF